MAVIHRYIPLNYVCLDLWISEKRELVEWVIPIRLFRLLEHLWCYKSFKGIINVILTHRAEDFYC